VDSQCSNDETPYHEVSLGGGFIDKNEVRAGDYEACVNANVCTYIGDTGTNYITYHTYQNEKNNHPINYVNWSEAKSYCEWKGRRLPTEAEWEKAARGLDGRKYPWGNEAASCDYAVMQAVGCANTGTLPVGSKAAGSSASGAEDMAGNVFEWTADWYHSTYYNTSPIEAPHGPESGSFRVIRGGSFVSSGSKLRTSYRSSETYSSRLYYLGFRCFLPIKGANGSGCIADVDCQSGSCVKDGNNHSGICTGQ